MTPATSPLDKPQRCTKCGWQGLLSQTIKAAVNNAGKPNESYISKCPKCKTFNLIERVRAE